MAKVATTLSIDADVKAKVQKLYADLGLDLSTAVNIFFRQSLYENGLPFSVTMPKEAESQLSDDEKIDLVSERIFKEHRKAFEELAK